MTLSPPWSLRLLFARGRPYGIPFALKALVVSVLVGGFLYGDYRIFRRLFEAAHRIEELTPFFLLGLIENFLGLIFLIGLFVLFFSSMTSAIGALFTDLDLETLHAAPVQRVGLAASRLGRIWVQSSYLVILFLVPIVIALQVELAENWLFFASATLGLMLLLSVSVNLAATAVLLLVRFFPVRRVHQIAMTLAILVLTTVVVGIRMARPERLFAEIATDDVMAILQAIRLPAAELYPSSWLATAIVRYPDDGLFTRELGLIAALAFGSVALFLLLASRLYFTAFVRSRESSAPVAIGARPLTRLLDTLLSRAEPQTRALAGKEVRVATRDAAQWSQVFMMAALLFLYLYNIEMMPLEGDFRAAILAWLNLGMSGFVVAAVCLRFAYPSISAEGRQFWMLHSAPISFRRILWTKVAVYLAPLLALSLLLTAAANLLLDAPGAIWAWTLAGSFFITSALVAMGVGMGAFSPDWRRENPMEVALSLGGLAYMAVSMLYVGVMMFLLARPVQRFLLRIVFGVDESDPLQAVPIAVAVTASAVLVLAPIEIAVFRFRNRA